MSKFGELFKNKMKVEFDSEEKTILTCRDSKNNKKSQMVIYHILPGIEMIYNKFNMNQSPEIYENLLNGFIEINYCKRGVFECITDTGKYFYLGEGEMSANLSEVERKAAYFTIGYYEGISFMIDVENLENSIPKMFKDISVNMKNLKVVLQENEMGVLLKPIKEMNHIFEELYYIDPIANRTYAQLKILELLLVFTAIPFERSQKEKQYFEKSQIDKIKKIHKEITENLDIKITIEKLASKYNIGTTMLKKCFKEIYRKPIHTYLKDYKIHISLHLLEETNRNINEIAGILGYDNASKFSSAFKMKMRCTPTEYRKQKVYLEHERLFGVEID